LVLDAALADLRQRYARAEIRIATREPLPQLSDVPARRISAEEWLLRVPDGREPSQVLTELLARGASIDYFVPVVPSIEDIFVRLVEPVESG
jgi:ABC-type uncharacterized transport system ATPase subunit